MIANMKLGTKLVASFLTVALIGLIISIIGIMGMSSIDNYVDKLYSKDLLGLAYIKEAKINSLYVSRDWRSALLESDPALAAKSIKSIKNNIDLFKDNFSKGSALFYTDNAKGIIKEINGMIPEWERATLQMAAMIEASNLMQRTPELDAIREVQLPFSRGINERIDKLSKLKEDLAQQTLLESNETYKNKLLLMIVLVSVGFIASAWIGFSFSRSIMRQLGGELNDAVEQVKKVSQGNLNTSITLQPRDNSSLLYALRTMQETINGLISAQRVMAKKHDEGFISEKIDVSKFQGSYSEMAGEINRLVQSHIAVKMHVVDVVSQYARGDFSTTFERLPGEKVKITEAVDAVKNALTSISKEIETLVAASAQGDFSKRGDADHFQFLFKEMLVNLNTMMRTCEVSFGDVLRLSNALAQGDLTQTITTNYPVGAFNNVKNALNGTVENLKALVGEIKDSTDTINTASQEIAAGNNDLSNRTEQQAASLEETAASMQELTSTVQANSDNARHANEMALASSDIARKGVAVVNQVVTTMQDINESSRKVVDIITVIDGIAFQTNILALNAAVEAARAGEQGRGFAVVASEVRNLAQRAASAAGEIKALISDSVDKVEDGTELVARAGKTMEEIVSSIEGVTATIAQITAASLEQTSGIQQVNQAIGQMDDVTQQNAALVEEAAASAEALEEQTRHLSVTMNNFKIDADSKSKPIVAPVIKTYTPSAPVAKPAPVAKVVEPEKDIEAIDIDLDGALKKHAEWKIKLRTAITNKETLDAETISKDNCCDFGKWLHNEDSHSKIAHLQSYHDCVLRHADFHQVAGTIAHVINAKKYEDANKMLNDSEGDFIKNSSLVGAAIMRLKKDTAAKPAPVVKKVAEPIVTMSDDWEEF
jgi:methyl-accepting chemotaxis protein